MGRRILTMPRLGETMEEGRLSAWLVEPGQGFERGQAILEIETDKIAAEVPALGAGTLLRTLVEPGADVAVGAPVAEIEAEDGTGWADGDEGEGRAAPDGPGAPDAGPTNRSAQVGDRTEEVPGVVEADAAEERAVRGFGSADAGGSAVADEPMPSRATPAARREARRRGVDLGGVRGTGPRGRIEAADLEAPPDGTGGQIIDLPSGRLAYEERGEAGAGRVALLLHGFAGDRTAWAGLLSRLARSGVRAIAPDLPGHGATGIEAAGPASLAPPLLGLWDALALDGGRTEVVGHSLGAVTAVDLALALLARGRPPRRVTLVAPVGLGPRIDGAFLDGLAYGETPGAVAHQLRRLGPRVPALSDEALEAMAARLAKGRLVAMADALHGPGGQRVDLVRPLGRLAEAVDCRVIQGTADAVLPWEQVTHLPPLVAVHLLAGSGHAPHWDEPEAVATLLARAPPPSL